MSNLRKATAAVVLALTAVVVQAGTALAQTTPVDPTNGAYDDGVSSVQSFITDTAAGPLFLLAAVVVGIMVGLRWLKRSKSAAS